MLAKKYNDLEFPCPLGPIIKAYIAEKRSLGGKGNAEAKRLRSFSKMWYAQDLADELTEDAVKRWISPRPTDAPATIRNRVAIIRGLGKFMQRQGYKAYCPDRSCVRKLPRHGYDPHIFTYREVLRFMEFAESYASGPYCGKWSRLIVPLIFRMLYCTGMRAGEVVALEVADVDLAANVITVRDAKSGKTRYVPIHDELAGTIREYVSLRKPERYLFPSPREGHYGQHSLYEPFRKILFKAGIPHRGRGFGPRIHDFRHTFAVHSMMKWAMSGHDMATAMPRIAAYLGHKDVSETEWYLHLTIRIAPRLGGMLNSEFGKIFPREFQHDKQ